MHRILSKEVLAPDVVRFWVEAPHIARKRKPGQFVIIRLGEDGERIPLTIADVDKTRGAIALIVQGVGKTTRQLNLMNEGDAILDVAGPLGPPTEIAPGPQGVLHRRRHRHGGRLPHRARRSRRCTATSRRSSAAARRTSSSSSRSCAPSPTGHRHDRRRSVRREGPGHRRPAAAASPTGRQFDEVVAVGPLPMMRAVVEVTRPLEHPDHGQPEPGDGGRHRDVRRLPRVGGRRAEVRLRGRPRVRRPPGGFRRAGRAAARRTASRNRKR